MRLILNQTCGIKHISSHTSMSTRYRFVFFLVLLSVCFILAQYNIYMYWGATLLDMREDRMELLMNLGNHSITNKRHFTDKKFMTMCTMVKNEAMYIREWVEFHSLVGVDKFIICDNDSTDSLELALKGTIANVSLVKWPPLQWPSGNPHEERCQGFKDGKYLDEYAFSYCQVAAFHECLQNERGHSRWVAAVDVDEFFMPKYDESRLYELHHALKPYDHMHGISMTSFTYGTNHHRVPILPGELVIETHVMRGNDGLLQKEFVDPLKVETFYSVHWAWYNNIFWNPLFMRAIPRHRCTVRYNHYPYKSLLESRHKVFKNMNPDLFKEIDKWDKVDIVDRYMLPMVPLIRRRLAGEHIWINGVELFTENRYKPEHPYIFNKKMQNLCVA